MNIAALTGVVAISALLQGVDPAPAETGGLRKVAPWTVMIYGGVDSSAEPYLMPHLAAVRSSSHGGVTGEIVLLIDRVKGASHDRRTLGENFNDTRLFHLGHGDWERITGGEEFPEITLTSSQEINTGDARTLKRFIRFAKRTYPARRYALVIFGHGESRSACPDINSNCADSGVDEDPLFNAEITEVLTADEAVDVLWVDVCSYGGIENAYQFRPGPDRFHAQVMLATPPLSSPAPMALVLEKCGLLGPLEHRGPLAPSAVSFGAAAIDAIAEDLLDREADKHRVFHECWGCYDLSKAETVKQAVDRLAAALAEGGTKEVAADIRGTGDKVATMNYSYVGHPRRWVVSPYFDLYDLGRRMSDDSRLPEAARAAARQVQAAVDAMVVRSVGMSRYKGFEPGRNGIYIVFPGAGGSSDDAAGWEDFRWYHPFDQRKHCNAFGNYDWCRDGATPGNGRVENWFELLDSWFDVDNDGGGWNEYRW